MFPEWADGDFSGFGDDLRSELGSPLYHEGAEESGWACAQ
jgi:hypothetical protein